jgi:hypothetical protein
MAGVDGVLTATAQISFQAAEHGDRRDVDRVLTELTGDPRPESRAWQMALEAVRWSFDLSRGPAPRLDAARDLGSAPAAAPILCRVCTVMERVAFCSFDRPLLSEWIGLHTKLDADARAAGSPADLALATALLWGRLLVGELAGLDEEAKAVSDEASRQGAGAAVVEGTVVRALVALSTGSLAEATELGRRAARMAQAEALSHHEYLAHITLARIRRYSGRPHLALHILAALARVAPQTWAGWIGWETLLAGGTTSETKHFAGPSADAERYLRILIGAARAGDRATFERAVVDTRDAANIWPAFAAEVAALVGALDPLGQDIPVTMGAWTRGETAAIPFGLHGVGIQQDAGPQAESATAYVIARPKESGRRLLLPGLSLAPRAQLLARDSARAGARTETGIAALALAGDAGDSRDGFFRSVYGFTFVPYRHRAVLDTLCHRMRTLLGTAGEIRRDEGESMAHADSPPFPSTAAPAVPAIALVLRETIVVPDMRCILPTADRVLRALALLGATSATVAAETLHMPLRTVQAVLQELVSEGACTIERDGRRVAYKIEDTTFTQVTAV